MIKTILRRWRATRPYYTVNGWPADDSPGIGHEHFYSRKKAKQYINELWDNPKVHCIYYKKFKRGQLVRRWRKIRDREEEITTYKLLSDRAIASIYDAIDKRLIEDFEREGLAILKSVAEYIDDIHLNIAIENVEQGSDLLIDVLDNIFCDPNECQHPFSSERCAGGNVNGICTGHIQYHISDEAARKVPEKILEILKEIHRELSDWT